MDLIEVTRTKPVSKSGAVHGKISLNNISMGVTLEKSSVKIMAGTYTA